MKAPLPLSERLMEKFRYLSDHPIANLAGGLAMTTAGMTAAKPMGKLNNNIAENMNQLTNKIGSKSMSKTLKDVILEKRAQAQANAKAKVVAPAKKNTTSAQPKIGAADVEFVNSLVDNVKTASIAGWMSNQAAKIGNPGGGAGGMSGVLSQLLGLGTQAAIVGGAGSMAYGAIKDAVKKEMAYKQMFEEFPELNEMPRAQIDKYWGVLNDFAPKLTTNPLVAGQFVSNMINMGYRGIDHNTVGQIAQISGNVSDAQGGPDIFRMLGSLGTKAFESDYEMMDSL